MTVSGDEARLFKAIRLDSYLDVNKGELLSADETTGAVSWRDHVNGETRSIMLGAHAIRIVPRGR